MGLRDCLASAVQQGALSRQEAAALGDEFEERYGQLRAGMGDAPARAQARIELEQALRATAAEARRRAALAEAARLKNKGFLQSFRDMKGKPDVFQAAMALLSHYGFRGESSVRGRFEAIVSLAHGQLSDLMWEFRRKGLTGGRNARVLERDLMRELRGEDSGSASARAFAKALDGVNEDLRQRFNAAGGAIPRLENWGLPQNHDAALIRAAGATPDLARAAWKDFLRPLLEPDRMLDPLTRQPVGAAGLEQALDHVYDQIVSDGWAHEVPSMIAVGRGATATQRQDARFLVFRDADSWLAYHRRFGKGDMAQVIFHHINGMARDIAAMEVLGPNPAAMVEWLKQVVSHEIGLMRAGKPAMAQRGYLQQLFAPYSALTGRELDASLGAYARNRLDGLYMELRGRPTVIAGLANRMADARNVAGSAILGTTVALAATTDPWVALAARKLAGLPQMGVFMDTLKLLSRSSRKELYRTGIMWGDFLHVMQDEARFFQASGSDWSRWLLDRTTTLSGLNALTDARKVAEARVWQAGLADLADKAFPELPVRMREALAGFGVTPADWDIMRASVDAHGFVTPAEIASRGGAVRYIDLKNPPGPAEAAAEIRALAHRRAAEKLAELVSSWSERSVPTTTPNMRAAAFGSMRRGTLGYELMNVFTQLKGWSMSYSAMQLEALGHYMASDPGGRAWGGAKYGAAMAIPLTIGAGIYQQIKSLADGKDPQDMRDPRFWAQAIAVGGGLGLLGDFAFANDNRFDQSMIETLAGPSAALIGETGTLTIGTILSLARGEDPHLGREMARYLGHWTPLLASWWATRGLYRRFIVDQLQTMSDPNAMASFRSQQQNAQRRTGQRYWWEPGQTEPRREPDLGAAVGR